MLLLLDEDTGAHSLANALRADGHDVERVVDVQSLGLGAADEAVYNYAAANGRVLITKNGSDFADIAMRSGAPKHSGILVIHYGRTGSALPIRSIVRAIGNISHTYEKTDGLFLDVNHHVW